MANSWKASVPPSETVSARWGRRRAKRKKDRQEGSDGAWQTEDISLTRKEIRIAGFGGQGVVLAGQIVGHAASIYDRGYATLTQSYGPEARGGSCAAEVVISDEPISYPYVLKPQVMVILAQEAYHKYVDDESPGTTVIIDPELVKIEPSSRLKPLSIPATHMAHEMGRPVVANIIVLGFLAAVSDLATPEALKKAVMDSVPKGTEEFNARAFDLGYQYGLDHGRPN